MGRNILTSQLGIPGNRPAPASSTINISEAELEGKDVDELFDMLDDPTLAQNAMLMDLIEELIGDEEDAEEIDEASIEVEGPGGGNLLGDDFNEMMGYFIMEEGGF